MSNFSGLLSFSEAASIWGLDDSTLRKAVVSGRLVDGVDCRKFGKQWVVYVKSMQREYGIINWVCEGCGKTYFEILDYSHMFGSCICEECGKELKKVCVNDLDKLTFSRSGC